MTVLLSNRTNFELTDEQTKIFEKIAQTSIEYENFVPSEISVSIVYNDEIQNINKRFRGIDKPTDVLSFPLLTFDDSENDKNDKGEVMLGDIIISIDKAKQQSLEYGHSIERELAFLTAHSMLHLLGYDHMTKAEEAEMFKKQEEILIKAGYPRGVSKNE